MSMLFVLVNAFRGPLRIRSYLVTLFLLAMTPLVAFAVYMIYRSAEEERAMFRRGAIERTRAIMTAVDTELKNSTTTLEALATSETLDGDDLRGFYNVALRVFRSQHDWMTINVADGEGRQLMNLLRPYGAELPPVAEVEVVRQVFRTNRPAVGSLVLGTTTRQLDFAIRVPVVRGGRTKYVISGVVKPPVIGALLAKQEIPSSWILSVLDAKGTIVARTLAPETSLGRPASAELRRVLGETAEGWHRGRSIEGDDVYWAYARSPFSGWSVSLNVPAAVVDARLQGKPLMVALFGLGLMAAGVALALIFSRRTAASIESLSGMARDMALGNEPAAAAAAAANNVPSRIAEVEELREGLSTAQRLIAERDKERDAFESELWQQASLLELSHDAIFVFEYPPGPIVYWNRGAETLYGYTKAEALGRSPQQLLKTIHPGGRDRLSNALEKSGEFIGELIHTARDGRKVHVESRHVLAERDGRRFVLETCRDMSARVREERRAHVQAGVNGILASATSLTEAAPKLTQALGTLGEWDMCSIWDWDADAEEFVCMESWIAPSADLAAFKAATLGHRTKLRARKGLLGRVLESGQATWVADAAADLNYARRAVAATHDIHAAFCFPVKLAERTLGFVECYAREARAPDPDFVETLANIGAQLGQFIERTRAEEEVRRLNEELELRIDVRTSELERSLAARATLEEQLRQAQKMEAIGTLAGGIAHDFNNILGVVLGWARDLAEERGSSQALDAIISSGERGAAIVKQLLAFSRKQAISEVPVAVNRVVADTAAMLTALFPKTIEFDVALDEHLPEILGDAHQLQQALINICINARDAMPEGGRLAIRTAHAGADAPAAAPAGEYIRIEIADTGAGMDEATLSRVFEPFFTTKQAAGGTGLGLAVVYGIVQAHRGVIDVASVRGSGTTINIYLPIPSRLPEATAAAPAAKQSAGSGTLLIVDDEPFLLRLIKERAERSGYRVLTAADGVEAVATFEEHAAEIDAVVLDCGLPKLSGPEVFRLIKRVKPEIVVVGVSGYADPEVKSRMLQEGLDEFLHKPCSPDEILAKVLSCLKDSPLRP